jgi:hypothetical protein
MVPMLTCGLVRSNFAFATGILLDDGCGSGSLPGRQWVVWGASGYSPRTFLMISSATFLGTSA